MYLYLLFASVIAMLAMLLHKYNAAGANKTALASSVTNQAYNVEREELQEVPISPVLNEEPVQNEEPEIEESVNETAGNQYQRMK